MLRRELGIVLGAPVTWIAIAVAALVIGHGFVLALDLFTSASRAALAGTLMRRELDPLAGIVRPTLGGAQLAAAVLVPAIAARGLAVEKERNTFGALALAAGGGDRVLWPKLVAALAAGALALAPPVLLFALYAAIGGELDLVETGVAFAGHTLHVALVTAAAVAAAAWTRTVAQATTIAVVVSLGSWAVDAGEGYAALAWLGPAEAMSLSRQLAPFEAGIVHVGALAWFAAALAGAVGAAWIGARFDLAPRVRVSAAAGLVVLIAIALSYGARVRRSHDWTELARASLPPAAVAELRQLPQPIELTVYLDRDDSRRRQIERDALAKLRLARSDIRIVMPLDDVAASGAVHDDAYGRIVVHVGDVQRETRSTSRRELVTLIFEAAGHPLPDWSQPPYPGHPFVAEGRRRTAALAAAYFVFPGMMLAVGFWVRRRRKHS